MPPPARRVLTGAARAKIAAGVRQARAKRIDDAPRRPPRSPVSAAGLQRPRPERIVVPPSTPEPEPESIEVEPVALGPSVPVEASEVPASRRRRERPPRPPWRPPGAPPEGVWWPRWSCTGCGRQERYPGGPPPGWWPRQGVGIRLGEAQVLSLQHAASRSIARVMPSSSTRQSLSAVLVARAEHSRANPAGVPVAGGSGTRGAPPGALPLCMVAVAKRSRGSTFPRERRAVQRNRVCSKGARAGASGGHRRRGVSPELEQVVGGVGEPPFRACGGAAAA